MDDMIQVFKNKAADIRVFVKDGEPWFIASDVCEYFGVTNRNRVMQTLDEDEKGGTQMNTPGGMQTVTIVSEAGLYSLLFALQPTKARGVSDEHIEARCVELRAFKRWITHEVIPAIRQHGMYATPDTIEAMLADPDVMINALVALKDERAKRAALESKVKADAKKVLFADSVATSQQSILIGELAKLLRQNGIEIGQNRLFELMRKEGYLCAVGERRNLPTQRAMEMGLMEIKELTVNNPDGSVRLTRTPKITGKGQVYFVNRYRSGEEKEA